MAVDDDAAIREQVVIGLRGDDAHMTFEEATGELPDAAINQRPPNVDYTPWHLVEHLRRTQLDMLEYVRDPAYVSPPWPAGYWPARDAAASRAEFDASVEAFLADRRAFEALVLDPRVDILAPMPHAPEHSVARCARVIANHNSYHVGELAVLRQVMDAWGPGH